MRRGGERLLFDCGEGTQRQLLRSTVGLVELHEVFLTHYHADHYLGLPGMLKTFALRGRELPLTIYGPAGLDELFAALRRIFGKLTYELELVELRRASARPRRRRIVPFRARTASPALGYALVEDARPAASTWRPPTRSACPPGRERGALQRGEAGDARRRHASSRPSRCSASRAPGARS